MAKRSSLVLAFVLCASCVFVSGPTNDTAEAEGIVPNANQEMLADPVRPMVYVCDKDGGNVSFYNASTGALICSIWVGEHPMALDLSADGESLFVTVPQLNEVAVIDVEARESVRTISLDFSPLIVKDGRTDRLYISGYDDGKVRVVELSTGTTLYTTDVYYDASSLDEYPFTVSIEVSPDGNTLLATALGSNPSWLLKYDISLDEPVLLDKDYSLLAGMAEQAINWTAGVVYTAALDCSFVERISIDTLDRLPDMAPLNRGIAAISLSPDGNILYVLTFGPIPAIWALDAHGNTSMWSVELPYHVWSTCSLHLLACPEDNRSLFVGLPAMRLPFEPQLTPEFPVPDEVCFVIEEFAAGIWHGLPYRELASAGFLVNDTLIPIDLGLYEFDPTRMVGPGEPFLEEGMHEIVAYFEWSDGNATVEWKFIMETTWMFPPSLEAQFPSANGLVIEPLEYIEAVITDPGAPDIEILGLTASVDGQDLDAYFSDEFVIRANVTTALTDFSHTASVAMEWTDGYDVYSSSASWLFSSIDTLHLITQEHDSGFSIPVPGSWLVQRDQTVDGNLMEFWISGPVLDDITTIVLVDTGIDPSVEETSGCFDDMFEDMVTEFLDEGIEVEMVGDTDYTTISGHEGALVTIEWPDHGLTQRIGIVVSEAHEMFWVVICTVASSYFDLLVPTFDEMILGLEITLEPVIDEEFILDMVKMGAIIYAVFAAVAIGAALVYRYTRKN